VDPFPRVLLVADEVAKLAPIHILMHNKSIRDMSDVVKYLVEANPSSLLAKDEYDRTPLHVSCAKRCIKAETIKILLDVCPESSRQRDSGEALPIHILCARNESNDDDEVAIDILKLLLEAHPDSVSQIDEEDDIPLNKAANNKSPAFCKILVDAYPESVKGHNGDLPFHYACEFGRPDTVEYLFGIYPESLHIRNYSGYLPIHKAVSFPNKNTPRIIKFLLKHDPKCISKPVLGGHVQQGDGTLPLHIVCNTWDRSNTTELVFDVYPEAILMQDGREKLPIGIVRHSTDGLINPNTGRMCNEKYEERNHEMINFISTQMSYAIKAHGKSAMRTPDSNGMLPLHNAIREKAPLGSIKLLVKGNPDAINVPDGNGMLPLDIAIHFSTVEVVKYLAELSPDRLNTCDMNKNYPLHHACQGGNYKVIKYLLGRPMSSAPVLERNVDGMLPIHLFCEFVSKEEGEHEDEDTIETETIWRLLTAYPETVLN